MVGRALQRSGGRSFQSFQRQSIVIPPLCDRITRHNLFITADYFFLRRVTPLPTPPLGGRRYIASGLSRRLTPTCCLQRWRQRSCGLSRRRSRQRLVQRRKRRADGRRRLAALVVSRERKRRRFIQGHVSLQVHRRIHGLCDLSDCDGSFSFSFSASTLNRL
jgi:hypothetical protein